jgi:hypothetical protein
LTFDGPPARRLQPGDPHPPLPPSPRAQA